MARNGIQYEDVQRAIDTLLRRDEAPTVQKIRDILGTGSFTTISDHLREWRLRRERNRDVTPGDAPPEPLQEWMKDLWERAQALAAESLTHYRQEADRRVEEAHAETQAALRKTADTEERLAALNTHFEQAQARLEEKTVQLANAQSEAQAARQQEAQQARRVQQLNDECEAHQRQLEALRAEHKDALANATREHQAQLKQEEQRHEAAEARLMGLLDDARQERHNAEKQAEKRTEALEKKLERVNAELTEQRRHYTALEEKARNEASQRQALESKLRESQGQLQQAQSDNRRMERELEQQHALNRELREKLARLPLPPFVV
ncbi:MULTISPECIES: DNA-binding protein [Chromohalobacter]|uniref:DNA-binding protein n=1 Tax=Chromohalobacter TaxID=42054 RepID=UPI0006896F57|nr:MULTISPECIES: DNA-binding protein [Chromohalobacter]MDF9434414.1 DNA-binding protein [Chromohalobacter israelensis]NQY46792.1 DNA-binding protein [Chromohalobacter sp.]